MANIKKTPDFDVCVSSSSSQDDNRRFYTNVGAAWINGEVINIRLNFAVGEKEITLFPKKRETSSEGQQ